MRRNQCGDWEGVAGEWGGGMAECGILDASVEGRGAWREVLALLGHSSLSEHCENVKYT